MEDAISIFSVNFGGYGLLCRSPKLRGMNCSRILKSKLESVFGVDEGVTSLDYGQGEHILTDVNFDLPVHQNFRI